jgi:hypothetical protein
LLEFQATPCAAINSVMDGAGCFFTEHQYTPSFFKVKHSLEDCYRFDPIQTVGTNRTTPDNDQFHDTILLNLILSTTQFFLT